jgi:hypothetical protein
MDEYASDFLRKTYLTLAGGCERAAQIAAEGEMEARAGGTSHSPDFYAGYRTACETIAQNFRLSAQQLPGHKAEVIPIRGKE